MNFIYMCHFCIDKITIYTLIIIYNYRKLKNTDRKSYFVDRLFCRICRILLKETFWHNICFFYVECIMNAM